ncbi:MAG: M24 family metallopeptidase, partial [Planctomycetota bacterium]
GEHDHRVMQAGDLVLCDVGAEVENYAADTTRTFPVSGAFSDRQREVYDVVLRAADAAIAEIRPGVSFRELNDIARAVIEDSGYTDDMKHGLGHFLGLYVHDAGNYHLPLTVGTIITIEPGIYLADEAIGIRIEDDILVTENGFEVLTSKLPRTADEIERFMAGE